MKKWHTNVLLVAFLLIPLIIVLSPYVFQEGNPIPVAIGIYELEFSDAKVVKISDEPEKYLVKSEMGENPFVDLKKQQGFVFKDRSMGLYFEKDGKYYYANYGAFTRRYVVYQVDNIPKESYPF